MNPLRRHPGKAPGVDRASLRVRWGVLTDTHLSCSDEPPYRYHDEHKFTSAAERYSDSLRALQMARPDAILVLGDVTNRGDATAYADFARRSAEVDTPVFWIPGNHDTDLAPNNTVTRRGRSPRSLDQRNEREYLGGSSVQTVSVRRVETPKDPDERSRGGGLFVGQLSAYIDEPTIIASHFPVLSEKNTAQAAGLTYAGDMVNRKDIEDVLHSSGMPTVVLSGHLHFRTISTSDRILQFSFGAQIEKPFDVALIDIFLSEQRGSVRVRQIGPPDSTARAALAARTVEAIFDGHHWKIT